MGRRSAAEARRTRETIITRSVEIASEEGLEGITLGRLADEMSMSKAGVLGHFGSKQTLQLAAVEAARERFVREVWQRVESRRPGLERLLALCDAWLAQIARSSYPGGCFWAATSPEFDGRPGPVRDAIARTLTDWERLLERDLRAAVASGELAADTDVPQVLFELRAVGLGLNQDVQMHRKAAARKRARAAVRRALGVTGVPARDEPRLVGERVTLRPDGPDDVEAIAGILAEPEVARWWGENDAASVRRDIGSGFAVLIEGEVQGWLQCHEESEPDYRHVAFDIALATARHGRGYGQESLRMAIRHFIARGHHRFTIDPAVDNDRAIRTYAAVGFKPVGRLRAYDRAPDGTWRDGLLMELLAGELIG